MMERSRSRAGAEGGQDMCGEDVHLSLRCTQWDHGVKRCPLGPHVTHSFHPAHPPHPAPPLLKAVEPFISFSLSAVTVSSSN